METNPQPANWIQSSTHTNSSLITLTPNHLRRFSRSIYTYAVFFKTNWLVPLLHRSEQGLFFLQRENLILVKIFASRDTHV